LIRGEFFVPDQTLSVEGINVKYGAGRAVTHALKSVSLSFEPGKLTLLRGPSGSGKTTLMSVLGCMLKPNDGNVFLMGQSVGKLSEERRAVLRRRHIGYVFQSFRLFRALTALENLEVALEISESDVEDTHEAAMKSLEAVGLGDKAHFMPKQLSGGEKQRVAIARALVNDPPIILADEPTASLDSVAGKNIAEILMGLAVNQKRLVVVVSHDPRMHPYCQRSIVMRDGQTFEDQEIGNGGS
jgi:putative ABC transport system ATP-binding protein